MTQPTALPAEKKPARDVAPVSPHERSTALKHVAAAASDPQTVPDEAVTATPLGIEDGPPLVDEAAESAFLAEARERGEPVASKSPASTAGEETSDVPLPPLDELVQRIPAEVRDTLEDLFRARFTTVKRVPKKALKQP